MQVVQIDHIGFQPPQRRFTGGLDRGGPAIDDPHQLAVAVHVHALHTAFAGQHEPVAVSAQGFADEGLAGTKAVQRGGVEVGHTLVQRGQQQALGLGLGNGGAIGMADVHAAQADGTDAEGAELSLMHGRVPERWCDQRMAMSRT